ncbi:unnamed protein product, partial [Ilex paraguariensis]
WCLNGIVWEGLTGVSMSLYKSWAQNMKPSDITLDKALELLSSKDVKRCGRPKGKPKLEEAIEAM